MNSTTFNRASKTKTIAKHVDDSATCKPLIIHIEIFPNSTNVQLSRSSVAEKNNVVRVYSKHICIPTVDESLRATINQAFLSGSLAFWLASRCADVLAAVALVVESENFGSFPDNWSSKFGEISFENQMNRITTKDNQKLTLLTTLFENAYGEDQYGEQNEQ
jgi:hypothetical protein